MKQSVQTRANGGGGSKKDRSESRGSGGGKSSLDQATRDYLARIGRKGGQVKVPKGTAVLSAAARRKRGQQAARARWGKK